MEALNVDQPFGQYSPRSNTRFLRFLIRSGLSHGRIAKIIARRWIRDHGPLVDAEVRGVYYRFNLSDNTTDKKVFISSRFYDRTELRILADYAKDGLFVDIGANTGYYSLNLLRMGAKRSLAFEPNPVTVERLRFNCALNGATESITIVPEGVGPDEELEFFQTDCLGGASFVKPVGDFKSIRVRCRPLLSVIEEKGILSIAALKIDVEGFEDRALGPFLENAPEGLLPKCLVVEVNRSLDWKSDLGSLLTKRGYRTLLETRGNSVFVR